MSIPFIKAHGALNDFLLTWQHELPPGADLRAIARAICHRHSGIGADGWIVIAPGGEAYHARIRLLNADGSDSEISGNGTRCAAALIAEQPGAPGTVRISTGAGIKTLVLQRRDGRRLLFEMNMGPAVIEEQRTQLPAADRAWDATILRVGNPQCAVAVPHFDFDWRTVGRAIETHPRFPQRTNVSFVKILDRHNMDVRFFERGVGETMSSGTGSTGAVAMARVRGLVDSPVRVYTPAGPLEARWESDDFYLTGPAELTARGEFFWSHSGR
jgi:diaminopimelate epimerase